MIIPVKTSQGAYDIVLERGALKKAASFLNLDRRVLVVTDTGVPAQYASTVAKMCKAPTVVTIEQGEKTKSFDTYKMLLSTLVKKGFTRTDCVVAVGGGVVGDLTGFVAASFMRGVDFYNIPTTFLSQVDSSIGGKVAIDFEGYKNIVGAFYPPKKVIIDPDTLSTLPKRQLSNGLAESVKMSLTSDAELFSMFEDGTALNNLDTVIRRSLLIKKDVVEKDEKESGLRKILNFGHTVGHAIETELEMTGLYHGECVAIGMLTMCSPAVRARLVRVLNSLSLPTTVAAEKSVVAEAIRHDKKTSGDNITVIYVENVGQWQMKTFKTEKLISILGEML